MTKVVSKEELANFIGEETGVSDWFLIDQKRINQFADVTMDHQFIHVDEEAAAKTPFGSTIAHGFLTLSMLSYLSISSMVGVKGTTAVINYGTDKVRFLSPVKVNSKIRARVKMVEVQEKPGNRLLVKNEITVEIEDERHPALIADWLTLFILA